jgi:hypothetical protein
MNRCTSKYEGSVFRKDANNSQREGHKFLLSCFVLCCVMLRYVTVFMLRYVLLRNVKLLQHRTANDSP